MATATMKPTATEPATDAAAKPLPLTLAALGTGEYHAKPFAPGGYNRLTTEGIPRECLCVTFLLPRPEAYYDVRAAAVKGANDRMDRIRADFADHPKWQNVLSIEARLSALVAEKRTAENRAMSEAQKVRQAIINGDRQAEAAAAAEVKAAEAAAVEAANRHKIVAEQLPHARNGAREALRSLLEAERQRIEAEARAELGPLVDELTALVGRIAPVFAAANARAGVASEIPGACRAHGGPSDGLVIHHARLPH